MSAIERRNSTDGTLDELPQFELAYLFDDEDHPSEVTIFEDESEERIVTRWITMDRDHAVSLETVR